MEKYKISVIVPVYNVERYLDKCIESIIGQTYKNLEIILVDDGSTDNGLTTCRQYQKEDTRIQVIHQENAGLVAARKTGIMNATGEYIAFVDGDDWIEKKTFEILIKESDFEDILMYGLQEDYGYKVIDKINQIDPGQYEGNQIENIISKMLCGDIFFEFGILPNLVCKLIKANLLKRVSKNIENEITIGEDAAFSYSAIAEAKTIRNIDIMPYHYIQRNNSLVRKNVSVGSIAALYKSMLKISVPESVRIQWEKQLQAYMTFILQLKSTDTFIQVCSFYEQFRRKKVVIYGAGNYGLTIYNILHEKLLAEIVGIVDRDYQQINKKCLKVMAPEKIMTMDYDVVYIGILNEKICATVKENLKKMGIEEQRIIYFKMQDVKTEDVRKTLESMDK
jgi:glycosyltransferase involved in cell wall biosynthesis